MVCWGNAYFSPGENIVGFQDQPLNWVEGETYIIFSHWGRITSASSLECLRHIHQEMSVWAKGSVAQDGNIHETQFLDGPRAFLLNCKTYTKWIYLWLRVSARAGTHRHPNTKECTLFYYEIPNSTGVWKLHCNQLLCLFRRRCLRKRSKMWKC